MHELLEELTQFLLESGSEIAFIFADQDFCLQLAYLADIFSHLNDLCVSLQGREVNILLAIDAVNGFKAKLPLWIRRLEKKNYMNFEKLGEELEEVVHGDIPSHLQRNIIAHLTELQESFASYFTGGDLMPGDEWIRDPFRFNTEKMLDEEPAKEDLLELRASGATKFCWDTASTVEDFWAKQVNLFPRLARPALEQLIPFVTTYLCEAGFSALLTIKSEKRNRLMVASDMRVSLSDTLPCFEEIHLRKQDEKFH